MDLFESLADKKDEKSVRGITLNSQVIDLFNIVEKTSSHEDAVQKVYEYLEGLLYSDKLQNLKLEEKIEKVLQEKVTDLSDEEKAELKEILLKNTMPIYSNWQSKENLEKLFETKTLNPKYIDTILDVKRYFKKSWGGSLSFLVDKDGKTIDPNDETVEVDKEKTYQKVEALYQYVIGNFENRENRFNRLTLDGQGKFGTVAGSMKSGMPEEYNLTPLIQGYEFAKAHGMSIRINTLVFFRDFPDGWELEDADTYKTALKNYGRAIATVANEYKQKGVPTTIDMFNEFVDYYPPFSERTNNWMSKLSVEDLCEIAVAIKQEMPDADFGYNDWNFENDDKRKAIFEVIKKIQEYEKKNHCKIIDHIGTQCHTSINDLEGFKNSIEELQQFGLPIDITELDISKGLEGVDYEIVTPTSEELRAIRKYEQKLQNDMMRMIKDFIEAGKIREITVWSVTDEVCCDFCEGKEASVTKMNYDSKTGFSFSGKDIDTEITMTPAEMELIKNYQLNVKKEKEKRINQNPVQDFCFHTHTTRCRHAATDINTPDEEWIKHAIKGGIKKLAFTDHVPLPAGKNHKADSRMDIAELDSYLKSIQYLKEKYEGQIEIESGFEFEYLDRDKEYLKELKEKTDKMVLGQHFVSDSHGREYGIKRGKGGEPISDDVLKLYAESIIAAIKAGIPDVIAHPDLFMQARDEFGEIEKQITAAICDCAIKHGIPLEINFGKMAAEASKVAETDDIEELADSIRKNVSYPCQEFWKYVAENYGEKVTVIYGKDAHCPEQLSTEKDYELARKIIGDETLRKLKIVTKYKELENREKSGTVQQETPTEKFSATKDESTSPKCQISIEPATRNALSSISKNDVDEAKKQEKAILDKNTLKEGEPKED